MLRLSSPFPQRGFVSYLICVSGLCASYTIHFLNHAKTKGKPVTCYLSLYSLGFVTEASNVREKFSKNSFYLQQRRTGDSFSGPYIRLKMSEAVYNFCG